MMNERIERIRNMVNEDVMEVLIEEDLLDETICDKSGKCIIITDIAIIEKDEQINLAETEQSKRIINKLTKFF